jgi:predicted O-methyltransferase YrrM
MSIREFAFQSYHRLRHSIDFFRNETSLSDFVPRGHYHSPLPDIEQSCRFIECAMDHSTTNGLLGIRLNKEDQKLLIEQMTGFASEFDWPAAKSGSRRFHTGQGWFNVADSFVLYAMLRLLHPGRIVEIGSGFSSALMLDAREYKSIENVNLVFIDPHPQRLQALLKPSDVAAVDLIERELQTVSSNVFDMLLAGDILFVDSSHISRSGSDLNHIIFEILPKLSPGVWIHFHDIFWPFEYPAEWIRRGRSWNEAYLLRAFLMFNDDFEVAFWAPYAALIDADRVTMHLSAFKLQEGQSIWIRRVPR